MRYDRRLHLLAGAWITAAVGVHFADPALGFLVGSLAGLAKEALDRVTGGDPDGVDFGITVVGSALAAAARVVLR